MNDYAVLISILNLMLASARLLTTLARKRLVAIFWFLITYFSFFELLLVIKGSYTHLRGQNAEVIVVDESAIAFVAFYVFICNLLFAVAEMATWGLFGRKSRAGTWSIPADDGRARALRNVFTPILLVSALWYALKMRGLGYMGYVEFKASNWPAVFLGAATPLMVICMMQRKYAWALIGSIPFVYFAFSMHIRSFALMSIIPVAIVFLYQSLNDEKKRRGKAIFVPLFVVTSLIVLSGVMTYFRLGHFELPDSGMPYGMNMAFKKTMQLNHFTDWNSLEIYAQNVFLPFYKLREILLHVPLPKYVDTPEYIAWLIEAVPPGGRTYFHFPALWYTDAYVSFGNAGVLLAIVWGVLISLAEALMYRNRVLLALLLPYYTWHWYMICRGATAVAAVPFSYQLYITMIIFFLVKLSGAKAEQTVYETT